MDAVDGDGARRFGASQRVVQRRVESHDVVPNQKRHTEHVAPREAVRQKRDGDVLLADKDLLNLGVDEEVLANEFGVLLCKLR